MTQEQQSRRQPPHGMKSTGGAVRPLRSLSILPALVLALLVIGGCAGVASHGDSAFPSPVVLRDPAPGQLDLFMGLQLDRQVGDTQVMARIHLSFSSGGRVVQFAGGDERVTCDGHDLVQEGAFASFEALQAPAARAAGTTVYCQYAAGGAVADVSLQIPMAPAITSPQMGAQVVRSAQTPVAYTYDAATTSLLGIVALTSAPSSPPNKAIAKLNTPAPLHATLDTSGFAAGPGSLVLTASLKPRITETDVPFKSVNTGGNASVPVFITWV